MQVFTSIPSASLFSTAPAHFIPSQLVQQFGFPLSLSAHVAALQSLYHLALQSVSSSAFVLRQLCFQHSASPAASLCVSAHAVHLAFLLVGISARNFTVTSRHLTFPLFIIITSNFLPRPVTAATPAHVSPARFAYRVCLGRFLPSQQQPPHRQSAINHTVHQLVAAARCRRRLPHGLPSPSLLLLP